jgi:hypothetical protein
MESNELNSITGHRRFFMKERERKKARITEIKEKRKD